MNQEVKNCQNCKKDFTIESDDFSFYEKMKVPPPTFCPECRFQRRLMFRNDRKLYKRKCDLCAKDVFSNFSPDKPFIVYCPRCWWSDQWDGTDFGKDYNPNKNFFNQLQELQLKIPYPSLWIDHQSMVNSDYCSYAGHLKNCYLVFNADFDENCYYSDALNHSKDSMDCYYVTESELCYENIASEQNSNVHFSQDCKSCYNVYFSKDLVGCSDCFGCVGLRRKQYYIFNKPYSKEDYKNRLSEFNLSSFTQIQKIKKEAHDFWLKYPQKFMHGLQNLNVSGDYIYHSKNAKDSYMASGMEDCRFVQFVKIAPTKDCYDYTEWGNNAQRLYECLTVGEGADSVKFSFGCVLSGTLDNEYSMVSGFCQHIFGCIGLKRKSYCILNKNYSKEDYQKLRLRIIEDMNKNPYIDSKGRLFKYGEFFPYELSFFAYNESTARYYFPKSREEILAFGWHWKNEELSQHTITKKTQDMPDDIKDTSDDILKEVIECNECGRGFKIVSGELNLLRKWGFALPRKCPECRFLERLSRTNPPVIFYSRKCFKCQKELISTFSPEKPDIIYCEQCYQAEVV